MIETLAPPGTSSHFFSNDILFSDHMTVFQLHISLTNTWYCHPSHFYCPTGTLDGPSKKLRLGSCVASLLVLVSLAARWIATGAPFWHVLLSRRETVHEAEVWACISERCKGVWYGVATGAEKDHVPFFYPFFLFHFSIYGGFRKPSCRWHCFEVQVAPAEVYQMCLARKTVTLGAGTQRAQCLSPPRESQCY